jgi:hypothetical protein
LGDTLALLPDTRITGITIMDCAPPETMYVEIKNEQGLIVREGRTILYWCADNRVEQIVLKPVTEAKKLMDELKAK